MLAGIASSKGLRALCQAHVGGQDESEPNAGEKSNVLAKGLAAI